MKNHQSRPTGSLAIPEANVAHNNYSGRKWEHGRGRGRGRGRGHFDKKHFNGRKHSFKLNTTKLSLRTKLVHLRIMALNVSDVEVRTTGRKHVAHPHIYANYTKHLSKKMRKKRTMWTHLIMLTLS
ncbi:hypothetical protein QVD17_28440 [Tagetes erecta]|uniref:Uncharacterized protein n=1 Tax=Tagetes erecta TaxID=13708 RepID=A0AAD8KDU1_TARER|nr:hypothetical protein QVD17_28440 [Tagetes erecta]